MTVENVLAQLEIDGFSKIEMAVPSSMLWQPDIVVTKSSKKYYVLFRSSTSIPPSFLDRISISSAKFNSIIIFSKKCSLAQEKELLALGIGIGYFVKSKLILKIQNVNTKVREARKKLPVIDIFVSSKQDISERKFVENRIEMLRKIHSYPFNPPHLIEYDAFKMNELYSHIDSVLEICEWIVIILEENNSDTVKYEIKQAIEDLDHDNIFIFVKAIKVCHDIWKEELDLIKALDPQTIKYIPYSDQNELEVYLSKAIQLRMDELYKKNNI